MWVKVAWLKNDTLRNLNLKAKIRVCHLHKCKYSMIHLLCSEFKQFVLFFCEIFKTLCMNKEYWSVVIQPDILPDTPDCPENLTISDWDVDRVDLKWDYPLNDGGDKVSHYTIEMRSGKPGWHLWKSLYSNKFKYLLKNYQVLHGQRLEKLMEKVSTSHKKDFWREKNIK